MTMMAPATANGFRISAATMRQARPAVAWSEVSGEGSRSQARVFI